MKFPVSPHIEGVQFPPISEVRGWLESRASNPGKKLIDLCQAVPDYPPAPELLAHLKRRLDEPEVSRYTPDEGLPEVRRDVCEWYRRHYGGDPDLDQVCLTIGASQAFWLAMTVLCREGDEVVLQAPAYFDHPMALQALGIRPVFSPFDPLSRGLPDITEIAQRIGGRTRALLLVSPSNPTGVVIPPETIRQLFDLTRRKKIALVLDETYNAFIDGPPHDLFRDTDWAQHFVHLASFGKTFALTGFRAGALIGSAGFIRQALKIQDTMAVCQPRITQHAVAFGCQRLDRWVASNRVMMGRRHDLFREAFTRPGNRFELVASGGFFAWVRHPFQGRKGREVARLLVEKANIICLPGEVFGPGLEEYLRLAFGNIDEAGIPEAVERFREISVDRF